MALQLPSCKKLRSHTTSYISHSGDMGTGLSIPDFRVPLGNYHNLLPEWFGQGDFGQDLDGMNDDADDEDDDMDGHLMIVSDSEKLENKFLPAALSVV